jgi:hypothetical protein
MFPSSKVPAWYYGVDPPRKLIDIADFGKFALELIDAPDMSDLFIDVDTTGLEYTVNTDEKYDRYAMIEGYKFPLDVDYFEIEEGAVLKEGVTYYAPEIDKLFISANAIELLEAVMAGESVDVFPDIGDHVGQEEHPDVYADYSTFPPDSVSGEVIAD